MLLVSQLGRKYEPEQKPQKTAAELLSPKLKNAVGTWGPLALNIQKGMQ